jgi:hypothetical protein
MTDLERKIYLVIRKADEHFEKDSAAGTKTWIREYFLPYLEEAELEIVDIDPATSHFMQTGKKGS